MKTCILCDHQEPGLTKASPDVEYVCGSCVQVLVKTSREELAEKYKAAVQAGEHRKAYALSSFVPRRLREEFPCEYRPLYRRQRKTVSQVAAV